MLFGTDHCHSVVSRHTVTNYSMTNHAHMALSAALTTAGQESSVNYDFRAGKLMFSNTMDNLMIK